MAAAPHHRHQSSLEGITSFSSQPPLGAAKRARAHDQFYRIINHFEDEEARAGSKKGPYNRPRLVRLIYEHARSQESKDLFLRAFFQAMDLQIEHENGPDGINERLGSALTQFADHLIDHFFLPCTINCPLLFSSLLTPFSVGFLQ